MKITLIGMMGTGKTVVGKQLAEILELSFADIDEMVEARVGMSIEQAFIYFGEKTFRSYETSSLCEVVWHDDIVISCGGGVPLSGENMKMLESFVKVRLIAQPDTIYNRVKDDFSRPLLKNNSPQIVQKIVQEREESYSAYADITIDTEGKTVQQVAEEAAKKILAVQKQS
jgi:shikimate kinase